MIAAGTRCAPFARDRRCKAFLPLLILFYLPILLGSARPSGLGDVRDVRTWSYPDYTRVVVEFSQSAVAGEVKHLPADPKAGLPERLYLDIAGIWVGTKFKQGIAFEDGLLQDVRLGQNTLRKTRLVIDLKEYARHRLLVLRSPDRVVVDVYGPRSGGETMHLKNVEKGKTDSRLSLPLRSIQTVVIDPGHGGRDPGALGLSGLREKDVNLRLSKKLGKRLAADGFKVVFTRNDDRTLTLEERTAIAEAARGDLFISVHTNASKRKETRGIEIYILDKNHERHSLDVIARENGISRSEVDMLQRTMIKLRFSEVSRHSVRLANNVHDSLIPGLEKRYRGVPDLGVKNGPFYVLYMASMPAILLETGFLTNREDAKLLKSDKYLEAMAEYVAAGLSQYRTSGTQLAEIGELN